MTSSQYQVMGSPVHTTITASTTMDSTICCSSIIT